MKGGADLSDLAEYYDWFKHAAVSLKWIEGSLVLWRIADSAYPVINYKQTYDKGKKCIMGQSRCRLLPRYSGTLSETHI